VKQKDRRAKLRELWLERPEENRTTNDLLLFYNWVERNWPELLTSGHGDPYQQLKSVLSGLWRD
jgi:hypothetical protein